MPSQAEGDTVAVQYIYSEVHANNVKYVYSSASGHIVDSSEFISGIYIETHVSYVHIS